MAHEIPSALQAKLSTDELRAFAASRDPQTRTVIVEPDISYRRVELGKSDILPGRFRVVDVVDVESVEDRAAQVRIYLRELTGLEPRWLDAARAFSVRVDGSQLAQMTTSPLIRAAHPNRELST